MGDGLCVMKREAGVVINIKLSRNVREIGSWECGLPCFGK
jgi:hypothetical protein